MRNIWYKCGNGKYAQYIDQYSFHKQKVLVLLMFPQNTFKNI